MEGSGSKGEDRDGEISICCADRDIVVYPLAEVQIAVDGVNYSVEAAVSKTLPVSVLLGRDDPELVSLQNREWGETSPKAGEVMVVITWARKKQLEEEVATCEGKDQASAAMPEPLVPLHGQSRQTLDQALPWEDFDSDLFQGGREKVRLTKRMRRANNFQYLQEKATQNLRHPLDLDARELRQLQEGNETLTVVRKAVKGQTSTAGSCFYEEDGLIYRRWKPPGRDGEDMGVEQLVLPFQCRKPVLKLAHEILLAGHMGRRKTAQRILQRFCCSTLFKDIKEFCESCSECQKPLQGETFVLRSSHYRLSTNLSRESRWI